MGYIFRYNHKFRGNKFGMNSPKKLFISRATLIRSSLSPDIILLPSRQLVQLSKVSFNPSTQLFCPFEDLNRDVCGIKGGEAKPKSCKQQKPSQMRK